MPKQFPPDSPALAAVATLLLLPFALGAADKQGVYAALFLFLVVAFLRWLLPRLRSKQVVGSGGSSGRGGDVGFTTDGADSHDAHGHGHGHGGDSDSGGSDGGSSDGGSDGGSGCGGGCGGGD